VLVEAHALARKPANLSFTEAAAVPLVLITAWEALHDRVALGDGQQVLIHAGAGGVGHVAIQLARLAGARIATTVSTDSKAELVRELGAGKVILYRDQNVVEETLEWTGGRGADVVMDNVGGKLFEQSFPAVRVYGDLVTLLQPGTDVNWSVARQRNLRVSLEVMLTPWLLDISDAQIHQARILAQARMQFDAGQLKVLVSEVLPLREAARAHELIETGSTVGKIVLEIDA
ncbi:MAG: zinc-binding dehydrogenase, partial [Gammaproteobacteria bacterium]